MIDLVNNLRGGGGMLYVPGRVLDTLLEPQKAMGLDWGKNTRVQHVNSGRSGGRSSSWDGDDEEEEEHAAKNWMEWVGVLAGF